jgi:hypothetical protein
MKQLASSVRLASFLLVCMASACGREDNPTPIATTSLTSGKVEAPARPTSIEQDLVYETPTGGGDAMLPPRATAPTRASQPKVSAVATAPVRAKTRSKLDEAISEAVDEGAPAPQPEAPPAEPVGQVTTTSGTLPAPTVVAGAPARVTFDNRLASDYQLERVRMLVDGVPLYDAPNGGTLQVPPGDHTVEVIADYRLSDPIFTYVDHYRIELKTTGVVPASDVPTSFAASAVPSGGLTSPLSKRATLTWHLSSP